ncbi:hypothetical protein [Roseinatronobacter alkalisoli]|uniref:Uncharacterized protein n=1 Tax=Roseinatronobacter alkalisoli TaxID=3028235 RepID=A0ABT5TBQ6_9RHOB|nr:hypothetical protein [Roseinatronobacter sp. HJB301]MDD7972552.1 hypothetical protein [Roseinatronobacter sp. HJB301]
MRKLILIAAIPALLAACGTPQDRCTRVAQADLRALDAQIADVETALAKGYRILPAQEGRTRLSLCAWPREPVLFCTESIQRPRSETREVIDRQAEQARLQRLRQSRAELVVRTTDRIAACRVP